MVLGITSVNQNQIIQFVSETGITYPIIQDESTGGGFGGFGGEVYDDYYIPNQGSPYPRDFIVNQNGTLVYANNEIDTEYMIYILDELLSEEDLVTNEKGLFPSQFSLFPAYPNPFNPTTTIRFNLLEIQSKVTLHIIDITGRVVETLVDAASVGTKYQSKSVEYEVVWNASNQASGIYFAYLKSGSMVKSQKLILIK